MKNIILFLLIISVYSCSDSKISNNNLESLRIDNLNTFVPVNNMEDNSKVVFTNEDGEEAIFTITSASTMETSEVNGLKYERELKSYNLININDSSYSLNILLSSHYHDNNTVVGLIDCSLLTEKNEGWIPMIRLDGLGNARTGIRQNETFGSKSFSDVFSNVVLNDEVKHSKIFYNYKYGFVGFHDELNELWYLDRYEK